MLKIYSNFMKYTIKNKFFNIIITLVENIPILLVIDMIYENDIIKDVFTPLYFLSPTLYLELMNEKFANECRVILNNESKSSMQSSAGVEIENSIQNTNTSSILMRLMRVMQEVNSTELGTGADLSSKGSSSTSASSQFQINFFSKKLLSLDKS